MVFLRSCPRPNRLKSHVPVRWFLIDHRHFPAAARLRPVVDSLNCSRIWPMLPFTIPSVRCDHAQSTFALTVAGGQMSKQGSDWRENGIRIVHGDQLDTNTPQTPGMNRAAARTH